MSDRIADIAAWCVIWGLPIYGTFMVAVWLWAAWRTL